MKVIVQIPCLNEENSITQTIKDIPRKIPGVSKVEILVIDDGSTDNTVAAAKKAGADYIYSFHKTKGLGGAFVKGFDLALKNNADIIVNTDGDNQYKGSCIPDLVKPIIEQKADIVLGDRGVETLHYFSFLKRQLQKLGNMVVRGLFKLDIPDATTGFRAFSREAALEINIKVRFSHTLETLFIASEKKIPLASVLIETNSPTRRSRLASHMFGFINKSMLSILRIYLIYMPFKIFLSSGLFSIFMGILVGLRFIFYTYLLHQAGGKIQSLILTAILIISGFILITVGLLSDMISSNMRITEDLLTRIKGIELNSKINNSKIYKKKK